MLKKSKSAAIQLIGCLFIATVAALMIFVGAPQPEIGLDMQVINSIVNEIQQIQKIEIEQIKTEYKVKTIAKSYKTNLTDAQLDSVAKLIHSLQFKYTNINPDLICAHISAESGWQTRATSSANAKGLIQIINSTGEYLAILEGYDTTDMENLLYNPIINIKLGSRYMAEVQEEHGLKGGIVCYNSGPKYAARYNRQNSSDNIPIETQKYLPRVLGFYDKYRTM